jgi:hypothetical protein
LHRVDRSWIPLTTLVLGLALAVSANAQSVPPPEYKLAFLGDQGIDDEAEAVLELVLAEGAEALVHLGDFDYDDDPQAWMDLLDSVLGPDFPVLAVIGNHDVDEFFGPGGYQELLEERMQRHGIVWEGDLGIRSAFTFQGIHFVQTAPGVIDEAVPGDYAAFIREQFLASNALWRVSAWHKNQNPMQTGSKKSETGWGVYEESRRGGALVATGHEHSYARSHLLRLIAKPIVADRQEPLTLDADDSETPEDEGRTLVFVSGLGGRSVRNQDRDGYWWASVYTSDQGAAPGALFGVFHHLGSPSRAAFYFKDVNGRVIDAFRVGSALPEPVPEPDSAWLLLSALATLNVVHLLSGRRRREEALRGQSVTR